MTTAPTAPRSLLSATARCGIAAAVAAVLAVLSFGAMQASHDAVHSVSARFAPAPLHATLPRVEILVKRDAAAAGS